MRGALRMRLMQLASLRGAVFLLALGAVIWLMVMPGNTVPTETLFASARLESPASRAQVETFMPFALLGMTLLTVLLSTGPSFHFSPSEINLLFVGPFSRRDLLLYKVIAYATGAALSSAFLAPFAQTQTGSVLSTFTAAFLTLLFIQLNSAAVGMAWQTIQGNRLARLKWPALALVCAVVLAALIHAWAAPDRSIAGLLSDVRHALIGTILLMPYIVFAELFLAQAHVPDLAFWAAVAILINLLLLWVIIKLDHHTAEASLREHSRLSARWDRLSQGGSFWATERNEVRSLRRAPALGSLGPIAWRQAIKALRNSSKVIAVFLVGAAGAGPLSSMTGISPTGTHGLVMIFFFFGFILPRTLICDFRGDLSRMETYKTLPIPPWRICIGQLLVQVLLSYAVALTMIVSFLVFDDRLAAPLALTLAAFALPFTLLLYAVENTIFLLFPAKLVPMGRADFEFLGRTLIEFIMKSVVLILAVSLAVGVGIATYMAIKTTWVLPGLAGWVTLFLLAGLATILMQFAFKRFVVAESFD